MKRMVVPVLERLNKAGIWLSLICAVHCVVTPIAMALLPFMGLSFLHDPVLEFALLGSGAAISFYTVINGYRRHHHDARILSAVFGGFTIMFIGHLPMLHGFEALFSVIGASIAAVALYFNMKVVKMCTNHVH